MTIITVKAPQNRLNLSQRRQLAETLTDAVLIPEVGQHAPAARVGFQVHFEELSPDAMAIGGKLLSDYDKPLDVMAIEIAVMDAAWPADVRTKVISKILSCMATACGIEQPSPTWWVTFSVIPEGSWGSRGGVLSILDLLGSGVFTPERIDAIKAALDKKPHAGQ